MKTAIAAPSVDPFDDLFEFIDKMTALELMRFALTLQFRLIGKIAGEAGDNL